MDGVYVYLIESVSFPGRRYVGLTRNFTRRLSEHNRGEVNATWRYKKWRPVVTLWFDDMKKAENFEEYLKHGSGYTFAKRHFW